MKHIGDDKIASEEKSVAKQAEVETAEEISVAEVTEEKPAKKFEGRGLAGVVKKLSEEKLEDKAKRITEKLEKNPDKKDKVVEKEKKATVKKTTKKAADEDAEAPAKKTTTKKTTKK